MILILSGNADEHVPLVTRELDLRGTPYLCFDPGFFPENAHLNCTFTAAGTVGRMLRVHERDYDLAQVTAVWNRRPNVPVPQAVIQEPTVRNWVEISSRHVLEGVWDSLDCLWIPAKPVIDRDAHNKLKQLSLASRLGFTVPETLITNEPSAFIRFFSERQRIVAKSLIQRAIRVDGEDKPVIYTRPVYRRNAVRYLSIQRAPVIFQEAVPKRFEVRATVVGKRVFAAEIHSQECRSTRHDWRHYDDPRVRYAVHHVDAKLEASLVGLVESMGLCFGAIDLILTPSDEYVFLEINPNGQWGFIQLLTGLPVAAAIADLLSGC